MFCACLELYSEIDGLVSSLVNKRLQSGQHTHRNRIGLYLMGKTTASLQVSSVFHFDIFLASSIAGMEYKIIKIQQTPSWTRSCLSFFHTFHCSPPGRSSGVEMPTNKMKQLMHLDCSLKTTALTNSNSRLSETCHSSKTYSAIIRSLAHGSAM